MKIKNTILNAMGAPSITKLLIVALLSFFTSQMPAFAVWVGHEDSVSIDDEPDEEGEYNRTNIRSISVYFRQAKPNGDYKRETESTAKDAIRSLLSCSRNIELDFNDVKTNSHIALIKKTLNNFSLGDGEVTVDFHDDATTLVKEQWKTLYQRLTDEHDSYLEEKQTNRERREQEYDDFAESHGASDAGFMKSMGYFPSDSDDDY